MNEVTDAGAVRSINRDRQTRELIMEGGDTAEIKRIAGLLVRANDATFTQDDILFSA